MLHHLLPQEVLTKQEPCNLGLEYTSVQRLEIKGQISVESGSEELCLVVIKGDVFYQHQHETGNVQLCDILYLPIDDSLLLAAENAVVMRFGASCSRKTSFSSILFTDVDADSRHNRYGKACGGTERDVWNCIDEKFDSSRFLVGICFGNLGGWTAWPPHEHGEKREETYCYFNMEDGFGLQCVYDEMGQKDSVVMVQEGHVISIPSGYHPNVGCPKTGLRYIYCMVSKTAEDRNFMDLHTQQIYGDRLE
ncbi:putative enzyme involved in inositol metabolism [Sphaerochaeta pleomorpha str. Grapes]|uniref:Putative enzyme involved in inositol metabolism n=1 Tax=Sphaerochaeta pleomorpha (strain ATCC BAA-1885 / DSM 22778 / Grapes) TaxID=158190 RepID=G8QUK5_SPHPG|nr:5-deoxy-glucuronate isomerase [Sphaerochaeta pleomorpha]AEV29238.1 putative enzyme involved in inositol metabolism [Sphaerochaeta pleomorpha str. Grapes]